MPRRGIATVADLRARCIVDPATHCWHWQGAMSGDMPRLWTFDHRAGEKRTMSGPLAAWNIAHNAAPPDWAKLVYRGCVCTDCLNPAHLRLAKSKAEIGRHITLNGARKGTHVEKRRASLALAMAASGHVPTAPEIVLAVRAAPSSITSSALATAHGIAVQTVSRIRRNQSHRHLLPVHTSVGPGLDVDRYLSDRRGSEG